MLVRAHTPLSYESSAIPHFFKRKPSQIFIRTSHKVSCLPVDRALHDHVEPRLRYKKQSFRVIDKMGSDGALQASSHELPLSSYETAMEALSSLITRQKRGDKTNIGGTFGKLDRMHMYVKILGLEEHIADLKIIHVAGTKGKGSTCAFCEAILRESGFRTGLFTSPHLIDVRERFRVDGLDISEDKFLQYFWDCWHQLKENITEDLPMPPLFQFLTVLAFKIFVCEKVDVAIIEVGLGGTRDSTNVIKEPVVCGIASLGMDHMEALGDSLEQIASHKAGIMKPQVPAFTVPQLSEAMDVLQGKASETLETSHVSDEVVACGSILSFSFKHVPLKVVPPLDPKNLGGLKLSLSGDHQYTNAGLAVALCRCWLQQTVNSKDPLTNEKEEAYLPESFLRGLSTARLSGRAQVVYDSSIKANSPGGLVFYLDGAHSPESMEVCARWFSDAVNEDIGSSSRDCIVGESQENSAVQHKTDFYDNSHKISKQVLLFNCMEVRDPHILLPKLVSTCASSGVHFSKALFVPSMSTYNKVTSAASIVPSNILTKDLSWQSKLQRIWEKIIHRNDTTFDENSKMENPEMLPSSSLLNGNLPHKCNPVDNPFAGSAVMPSLPLTIKWLRDCAKENPSVRLQVLVTGSLHLVGDVLKLLKK